MQRKPPPNHRLGMRFSPTTGIQPDDVFRDAVKDAVAGRHQLALEKLVWFHENTIRIQPSLSGVRRSYALRAWKELGDKYPPALTALRRSRDAARHGARNKRGKAAGHCYADFAAINHYLIEEAKTVRLFKWLHKHRPKVARDVYHRTEEVVARAKEFKLCGAYIDSSKQFARLRMGFRVNMRLARKEFGTEHEEYARKSFSEKTTRLVALLTLNERTKEAKQVVVRAKRVWSNEDFSQQLELAQQGRF
jgi:hypothetical protein